MKRTHTFTQDTQATSHCCSWPGCAEDAPYRAPVSPRNLYQYTFYCLEHIRQFNAQWNFYAGLTEDQVHQLDDLDRIGNRPTWIRGDHKTAGHYNAFIAADPFNILSDLLGDKQKQPISLPKDIQNALTQLGLTWPITQAELKTSYKTLAKRYHPDTNGNNPKAVEKLKKVNAAYSVLKTFITESKKNHVQST